MSRRIKIALARQNTPHGFPVQARDDGGFDIELARFNRTAFQVEGAQAERDWLINIRVYSKAGSVHVNSAYGHTSLAIDVAKDYDKRREVLDIALQLLPTDSMRLTLRTKLAPVYRRGEKVTAGGSEIAFVRTCHESEAAMSTVLRMVNVLPIGHLYMWSTPSMRERVQRLVDQGQIPVPTAEDLKLDFGEVLDPFLDWPDVDSGTKMPVVPEPSPAKDRERDRGAAVASSSSTSAAVASSSPGIAEEMPECMVCMDARANTMVLPCMHIVVCTLCSRKLKTSRDARTCLQCRRTIDDILQDE